MRRLRWLWPLLPALALGLAFADGEPPLPPLPHTQRVFGESFATSPVCAQCHSNAETANGMRDSQHRRVAPFDLWQSTMMANATRDPLWRAVVSAEIAATPAAAARIQQTCLRCHAPLASGELQLHADQYPEQQALTLDVLRGEGTLSQLALDGVSCTVCHQIQPDGLGEEQSYSGGWVVKPGKTIFGPHADPIGMPMRRHTGYTPTQGDHVRQAGLCGSCHTLFTEALDAQGELTGQRLPEQTPFLEWRNSLFGPDGAGRTCQACHVPTRDEDGQPLVTRIARNPGGFDFRIQERSPYGRHIFVGGNTLVPGILRDHAEELGAQAPPEAFDRTLDLVREQLSQRAAQLKLGDVQRQGRRLQVTVNVRNLAGHKLPTAHPSRRVWLRLRVTDGAGQVLFASGAFDDQGRIVGPDGAPLPSELRGGPVLRHLTQVTSPTQAVIYEAVMQDAQGAWTWLLTRGARFGKDSRLLPNGWSPDHADAEPTRPRGAAAEDPDFQGGGDRVVYALELPEGAGPVQVEATLLHQTLGARYAAELFAWDTPQVRAFRGYYEQAQRTPEELASAQVQVP